MGKKKPIKINLKTAIVLFIEFVIFIIILVSFIVYMKTKNKNTDNNNNNNNESIAIDKETSNAPNINNSAIEVDNADILDETIAEIINVDINEFKKLKNFYIGDNVIVDENTEQPDFSFFSNEISNSKKVEFKEEARKNFKLLETYILNSDTDLAQEIISNTENANIYSNADEFKPQDEVIDVTYEAIYKFYAYVCSGLIKNHVKIEDKSIKIYKIENFFNYSSSLTKFEMNINDKYNISYNFGYYDPSICSFNIYLIKSYGISNRKYLGKNFIGYTSLKKSYVEKRRLESIDIEKPIIYLYPAKDTEVSVKLQKPENLTCSYPKYKDMWHVLAHPDGNLIELDTNKNLYSLYYESKSDIDLQVENEGFVVKSKDTIKFLEEKLVILGLSEREAEEFIIYWLPKLEANKYNYIRFATLDEINANMPLDINPKPDTLIRILMTFKGLDDPIDVQEQKLVSPERSGFVAVEWGGTEIK